MLVHNKCGTEVHGNSKASTKPQHGYEIFEKETGKVAKTGISGQPLTNGGTTSPRALSQVNKLNKSLGEAVYDYRIVVKDIPNRAEALKWEL